MNPVLRHAVLIPPTFRPESRIPNLKLLLDKYSPYTRAAGQASQFTAATLEYLSIAGNATLRGAAAGWWRCGWIYLDTAAASKVIESCLGVNVGYQLSANATPALVLTAGDGAATTTATHGTTLSTATWYFFFIYYDGVNIGVSLNDGADVTAALNPYSPGATAWQIGADLTPANYFNGRMQCMGGADGTLTAAQRTLLYNGGTPLAYDQIPGVISQQPTFFYWELDEASGARLDLGYNAYSLTDNNTVTTAAGTVLNACEQWNNRATANHFSQATQAKKPVVRRLGPTFDGVDDLLRAGAAFLTGTSGAALAAYRLSPATLNAREVILSGQDELGNGDKLLLQARVLDATPNIGVEDRVDAGLPDDPAGSVVTVVALKNYIGLWEGTSAIYRMRLNTTPEVLSGGGLAGKWFGASANYDSFTVGAGRPSASEQEWFAGPIFLVLAWEPILPLSIIQQLERMVARDYAVAIP